jgi:hypothetical protein
MPDLKTQDLTPILDPDRFTDAAAAEKTTIADFSTEEGALAYADARLDRLFDSMRYALRKHIAGWPADDRELNTHEALRHLIRNVSVAHSAYMEADYANPCLSKLGATSRIQFQQPSPDCVYHTAPLHGQYKYRLRGYRGTASVLQLTVFTGHTCYISGFKMVSNANSFDTRALGPGSNIDVIISRDKPDDPGNAHWLQMGEGPGELYIRQYYGDWETEEPADLTLTCEGQPFPPALLTREVAEERFDRLVQMVRRHTEFYRLGVQAHLNADPHEVGEVKIPGAFIGTNYFCGHFRCRPDEAVIIEIDKPDCLYWNVALFQLQWEPGDWWARLSSYNLTQVHREADGRVRWVACWTDPGLPNWFDCSGRTLHLIAFRFFHSRHEPSSPRLKTVPLSAVNEHFPADTPRVTRQARRDLMERRLLSVYRRRCSDF